MRCNRGALRAGPGVGLLEAGLSVAGLLVAGLLVAGCTSGWTERAAPAATASTEGATVHGFVRPARVIPAEVWSDRQTRIIASGLRAERTHDGAVRVARDLLPGSDELRGVALPERLGGGFLFLSRGQSTSLWRAETWTGQLAPLATVEMRAERVEPGFDRLYLLGRRETRAVDVETGRGVDLGPLPAATSYRELRFGDGWTALAEVPLAGVLATFDGGQQWWPVPGAGTIVDHDAALIVVTEDGLAEVGQAGTLTPLRLPDPEDDELEEDMALLSRAPLASPARQRALYQAALLRGVYLGAGPEGRAESLVVHDTDLIQIDLSNGAVVRRRPGVVRPGAECQGVRIGAAPGFVCQSPRGGTLVAEAAAAEHDRWRVLTELADRRPVLSSGAAGVLFDGPCRGPRAGAAAEGRAQPARVVCQVTSQGVREVTSVPERALVVSSRQGIQALEPPRVAEPTSGAAGSGPRKSGKRGSVVPGALIDGAGVRRVLKLPADKEVEGLLTTGQWLGGGAPATSPHLSFWVVAGLRFAGVRVDAEGRVEVGPIQRPARRAILSDRFGFIWGAAGFAKETVDGGQSWHETSLPYRTGDADPTQPPDATTRIEVGCSAAGCVVGPWLRVGWSAGEGEPGETWGEAPVPSVQSPPASEGGRWRLECRPSRRSSRAFVEESTAAAARRVSPRAPRLRGREAEGSATWQPFWEWRAPALPSGTEGYSLGSHLERARLYAWGPAEASWGERGKMQVAFVDPFSIGEVHVTSAVRTPWSDARRAALAFGDGGQTGVSHLYSALDPSYQGGLLLLRSSAEVELFQFDEHRGPVAVHGAAELGLNVLEDAVQLGETWFTMQRVGSTLRLLRVRGGQVAEVNTLQLGRSEAPWARIVRSVSGRHLGLWAEGETGRVVYPLDPLTGTLGQAVRVPKLGRRPRLCADPVEGYLLTIELSPPPQVSVLGTQRPVDLARVTAQIVVGGLKPCVLQLSASTRDPIRMSAPARIENRDTDEEFLLTVTEQREGGRRSEMTCR